MTAIASLVKRCDSDFGQYDLVLRDGGVWDRLYEHVSAGLSEQDALRATGLPDRPGWRDLYEWVRLDAHDDEYGYPEVRK